MHKAWWQLREGCEDGRQAKVGVGGKWEGKGWCCWRLQVEQRQVSLNFCSVILDSFSSGDSNMNQDVFAVLLVKKNEKLKTTLPLGMEKGNTSNQF